MNYNVICTYYFYIRSQYFNNLQHFTINIFHLFLIFSNLRSTAISLPVNARSKMAKSETITLDAISLAIRDNFPNLVLEFVEENNATNRAYPVDLYFAQVKYIDKDRCVLLGKLDVAEKPFGAGTIEYNFNTQEFYRVSYSDKTTRSRRLHSLIVHNKEVVNELLTFISDYLYSTEDYENDVNANGPTPSKRH